MKPAKKVPEYRKVKCEICQKEVDVRGWQNHLARHDRDSQQTRPNATYSSDDPYLKGYRDGFRDGLAESRVKTA